MSRKLLNIVLSFVLIVSALFLVVGLASAAEWWDPSDGTCYYLGDEASFPPIGLGFSFNFYGQSYTQVFVNSNGNLTFEYENPEIPIDQITPIPDGDKIIIAPLFGDFNPEENAGKVCYETYETTGDAPSHVFVATWSGVPEWPDVGSNTFQVQLFEGSDQILFGYTLLDTEGWNHNSGTAMNVGIGYDNGSYINSASGDAILGLDDTNICYAPSAGDYIEYAGVCGTPTPFPVDYFWLDPDNPTEVAVDKLDGVEVTLDAYVQGPGDIDNAEVKMTLVEAESGDSYPVRCTNIGVVDDILEARCVFDHVDVGTYEVRAEVVGGYYYYIGDPAYVESALVASPLLSPGSTSGKGSFYWPDTSHDPTGFSFTMSYDKKGHPKGRLTLTRYAGGGNYKVTSKSVSNLAFGSETGFNWAWFKGECIYTGPELKRQSGKFMVYVEDGTMTNFKDRFWIETIETLDLNSDLFYPLSMDREDMGEEVVPLDDKNSIVVTVQ